mmetsp:Transcript_8229/g.13312  ORF Transcript_8229/g.13312 Transcript_8229/m.13312 type:complete len:555 (-) Transcript_8229:122-1786(-)|eukprot:CAMPEP_0203761780 /NCGR_PEP_ID=MMETSP0098-20131031/14796_1 /ASSEMBLY_ACC=CAM_ASM_000208 /TAXON_ID=96639 /ORGANISM=" , Strain NY0313808BC1" /LENGTH=554 /DNA_ID=CAMNT_0050655921 /DNA_START=200 /DNA_END=1864 /DNA_ORIENTATION=+
MMNETPLETIGKVISFPGNPFPLEYVGKLSESVGKYSSDSGWVAPPFEVDGKRTIATRDIPEGSEVWIVPHENVYPISEGFVSRSFPYVQVQTGEAALDPLFFKEPDVMSYCGHDDDPCVGWVALTSLEGITVVWPRRDIKKGEFVTRDWLPPNLCPRRFKIQRAARLVAYSMIFGDEFFADKAELEKYKSTTRQAVAGAALPGLESKTGIEACEGVAFMDPDEPQSSYKIFTDQEPIRSALKDSQVFVLCDDVNEADIVHCAWNVSNFETDVLQNDTIKFISQFPFEGGFVEKDLLPQTVRRYCFDGDKAKDWWLPCYDLASELPYFLELENHDEEQVWAVKQATGRRSCNIVVTDKLEEITGLMGAPGDDRIAQKYCLNPLLVENRKFDCRSLVIVKSFVPKLEAYIFQPFYARVAGKEFSAEDLKDFDVHITVNKYQKHGDDSHFVLKHVDLSDKLTTPVPNPNQMLSEMFTGFGKMMQASASRLESWFKFKAIYGVDWIPTSDGKVKLIEVNFAPDLATVGELYGETTVRTILDVLYTNEQPDPSEFLKI